jgi:heme A synthase
MDARVAWLRRIGATCVALTFLLMVVGAWVKATGSGLACPDWPTCYGSFLPPFPSIEQGSQWDLDGDGDLEAIPYTQAQVLYEWTHRAIVSLVGVPIVAFAILAWRSREVRPSLRTLPVTAAGLLVVQALLGMVTVATGNRPWATTLHLAMAVVLFSAILAATVVAYVAPMPVAGREGSRRGPTAPTPRFSVPGDPAVGPPVLFPGEEPHVR